MDGGSDVGGHGHQELLVDPAAIPELRRAFADALSRVDQQLERADVELRITGWANDPVSKDAAAAINKRSLDGDGSAVDMLRAYRTQLSNAVDNLDRTAEQYRLVESDNSAAVTREEQGAS